MGPRSTDLWITDSQDEQSLEDFFRDADQVHIPIFQRSYVWTKKQFDELQQDIRLIREGIEDSQFLGAIVAYERPRQHEIVGRLRSLAIVDGQQRILTLYIFVMAIVEVLARDDKTAAHEIAREFLLLPDRSGLEVNTRVVPAFDDRSQFRVIWDRLLAPEVLYDLFATSPPRPPSPSGPADSKLTRQYRRILKYVKGVQKDEGADGLHRLLRLMARKLTFVHLKLHDASAATKIFERLNFRGVKVGITDLVRNEVFGRVSDPVEAKHVFDNFWRPFEKAFEDYAEGFFFPYSLILNSNATKSELFSQLRVSWKDLDPEGVIRHMKPYQGPYMSVQAGQPVPESERITAHIKKLIDARRPSSCYPFVMKLLHAFENEELDESMVAEMLDALESFLVRRAIVGFEPTGLHALFKGMWGDLADVTPRSMQEIVQSKPTIQWPTDSDVMEAISERPLAKAKIVGYLLVEYDKSLPGDDPLVEPTVEHILPSSYKDDGPWSSDFSARQHETLKDTFANLIPLSSPMNSSLQASAYHRKRPRYRAESAFASARSLADTWDMWTPDTLAERASELAEWVVQRWPYGPG